MSGADRAIVRGWCVIVLAVVVTVSGSRFALGADCGLQPVCGGTVNHVCHCGDNVKWSYTLSGTLTNGDGTSPCTTSVGLTMGSNVTLTGDGTASIVGQGTAGSVGIQFNGSTGAKVTSSAGYLKVTAFERGVQFTGNAQNDTLERVESYGNTNGTPGAVGSYGIDLRGPDPNTDTANNTIQNVLVHDNADEGVHMGGGSRNNTLQNSTLRGDAHQEIYLTHSSNNQILNNTASVTASTGLASLTVKASNANTFTGNTLQDGLVSFTNDANNNVLGTTTVGDTITNARLEFGQDQDDTGTGPYRSAHDNVVTNVTIDNTINPAATACVNYHRNANASASDTLPYNNKVNGSQLTCNGKALIALSSNGTGVIGGQNCVGATTCNGHTCTEPGDTTDQLGIITVQPSACP